MQLDLGPDNDFLGEGREDMVILSTLLELAEEYDFRPVIHRAGVTTAVLNVVKQDTVDSNIRHHACLTLVKLIQELELSERAAALVSVLQRGNSNARQSACEALCGLDPDVEQFMDWHAAGVTLALIKVIQQEAADCGARREACSALYFFAQESQLRRVLHSTGVTSLMVDVANHEQIGSQSCTLACQTLAEFAQLPELHGELHSGGVTAAMIDVAQREAAPRNIARDVAFQTLFKLAEQPQLREELHRAGVTATMLAVLNDSKAVWAYHTACHTLFELAHLPKLRRELHTAGVTSAMLEMVKLEGRTMHLEEDFVFSCFGSEMVASIRGTACQTLAELAQQSKLREDLHTAGVTAAMIEVVNHNDVDSRACWSACLTLSNLAQQQELRPKLHSVGVTAAMILVIRAARSGADQQQEVLSIFFACQAVSELAGDPELLPKLHAAGVPTVLTQVLSQSLAGSFQQKSIVECLARLSFEDSVWDEVRGQLDESMSRQIRLSIVKYALDSQVSSAAGNGHAEPIQLSVTRENILEDVCSPLGIQADGGVYSIATGVHVEFVNENGEDAGGLGKEWLVSAARELMDLRRPLFQLDEDGRLYFSPLSGQLGGSEHLIFAALFGRLCGLALYYQVPILDPALSPLLVGAIFGYELRDSDVEVHHPTMHRQLNQLRQLDAKALADLAQPFVYGVAAADSGWEWTHEEVEIVEGGKSLQLEAANLGRFIDKRIRYRFRDSCVSQINAAQQGLNVFLNADLSGKMRKWFTMEELHHLLTGNPDVDATDWRIHTDYDGCADADQDVQWLWEGIAAMTNETRCRLLRWWSGYPRVCEGGFGAMPRRFLILRSSTPFCLPVAHTCSWQLDLPRYPSREVQNHMLMRALHESAFHLQ